LLVTNPDAQEASIFIQIPIFLRRNGTSGVLQSEIMAATEKNKNLTQVLTEKKHLTATLSHITS
jgi:hypothetical protein